MPGHSCHFQRGSRCCLQLQESTRSFRRLLIEISKNLDRVSDCVSTLLRQLLGLGILDLLLVAYSGRVRYCHVDLVELLVKRLQLERQGLSARLARLEFTIEIFDQIRAVS